MATDAAQRSIRRRVLTEWRRLPEPRQTGHHLRSAAELVPGLLKKLGVAERLDEERLQQAWGSLVGDFIARHSRPVKLDRRTLVVAVSQPAILCTLERDLKRDIGSKLAREFGEKVVRSVRFVAG